MLLVQSTRAEGDKGTCEKPEKLGQKAGRDEVGGVRGRKAEKE